MKGIILAGGTITDYSKIKSHITSDSILICADKGYDHAVQMNLIPNYVIGDMDSVTQSIDKVPIQKFPTKKDQTDTELAIDAALKEGCTEIVLLGASGTRLDHTIANILLLKRLEKANICAQLIDEHNRMRVITHKTEWFANRGDVLSLIPLNNSTGITTQGLAYPLNNESLNVGSTRGISNYFLSNYATIDLKTGSLLVIQAND